MADETLKKAYRELPAVSLKALKGFYEINNEIPDNEKHLTLRDLTVKQRRRYISISPIFLPEDFQEMDPGDTDSLWCADIPHIEGSIALKTEEGALCGHIFMTTDESIFSLAISDPKIAETAILRSHEFPCGERQFFIGFVDPDDATTFMWTFAYLDITEEVYFNGHRVICGEELWDGTI